jgi:hypothetical protein
MRTAAFARLEGAHEIDDLAQLDLRLLDARDVVPLDRVRPLRLDLLRLRACMYRIVIR